MLYIGFSTEIKRKQETILCLLRINHVWENKTRSDKPRLEVGRTTDITKNNLSLHLFKESKNKGFFEV